MMQRIDNATVGTITGLMSSTTYLVTVTPFTNIDVEGFPFGNTAITTSVLNLLSLFMNSPTQIFYYPCIPS